MRYFIDIVTETERLIDEIGGDFTSLVAARTEAIKSAREMMADRLKIGRAIGHGFVEILDESRHIVDLMALDAIATGASPRRRHSQLYNTVAQAYLLMTPNFTILEANRAYLFATLTDLASIAGRGMFDVFVDNPNDPDADGVRNLTQSLETVLLQKRADTMQRQRFDIRRRDGTWEERHWMPINYPVFDEAGEVEFIIHHVEDVTIE